MKHIPTIAAGLLGAAFIAFGLNHFLHFLPSPPTPPEGSPPALFFGAIYMTGFITFVKVLEILGGILVAIPKTRNFGLLVLGPIVINIAAINILIIGGTAILQPPVLLISGLSAYLLIIERKKFLALIEKNS